MKNTIWAVFVAGISLGFPFWTAEAQTLAQWEIRSSGFCLTAETANGDEKASLIQAECNAQAGQIFDLVLFEGDVINLVLKDTSSCVGMVGTEQMLSVTECDGAESQQFTLNYLRQGQYQLILKASGKCAGPAKEVDEQDKAPITLAECGNGKNQQFVAVPVD